MNRTFGMLKLQGAVHKYRSGNTISLPDLSIAQNEHIVITGKSGSGKSTLLHILGGLLKPTNGDVFIENQNVYAMRESERDRFRGRNIGIIFQQIHLVDALNVFDNLKLAQYMAGLPEDGDHIRNILESLELADKKKAWVDELSQGEKQRVGVARAFLNSPKLLLADEPTSSLDDENCERFLQLLFELAQKHDSTLIISTHDNRITSRFEKHVNLKKEVAEVHV